MKNKVLPALVLAILAYIIFLTNYNTQAQSESGWSQVIPQAIPEARAYHSMAYNGDSVVMYGGGPHQDWSTYEYSDGSWLQHITTEFPNINNAVMAYDPDHDETVLYAGSVAWIWKDNSWSDYYPENYPSPRYFPSMAYDPSSGQIILFGGEANGVMMNDIWTWDGENREWNEININGDPPPARWSAGMAFDGNNMILFGGGTRYSNFEDTWLWNGTTSSWVSVETPYSPGPRQGLSLAYDDASEKVFLFGGCAYPNACYGDLWAWDGEVWSERSTQGGPEARAYAAMAPSPSGKVVLFGGVDLYQKTFKDTWEWDETAGDWINTIHPSGPIGTNYSGMSYDKTRNEAVLFGGEVWPGAGLTSMGETWIWDSALGEWSKPDLSGGEKPSPRGGQGMAFYEGGGYTLLFGGAQHSQWPGGEICRNDTWRWDGVEWFELDPEVSPPCRWSAGMTYYDDADSVVLFGGWQGTSGTQLNDMWEWKNDEWTLLDSSTEQPEPRFGLAMAYDSERHRIVLFGGTGVNDNRLSDTWEYFDGQWHEVVTANPPPPSSYNRMVFDEMSRRIILLGYQAGGMWEFDGADWSFVMDGVDNPSARNGSTVVYDETRGSILLFGGNMLDDTWEYKSALGGPTVCLYASDGATGLEGGTVQYYLHGWQPYGETGPDGCVQNDIEDGQYTFRMGYDGATLDLIQDVAIDPLVVFQTTNVTVELRDSQGQMTDPGMVQYYASGWKDFGTTSGGEVSKELLPQSYTFRMRYAGAAVDRTQDVSTDPDVVFQTTHVTVELRDSQGQLIDPGVVQYYASGWKDFGTTSGGQVSKELLPKSYSFRMRYAGAAMDRTQDAYADPVVVFQTTPVTVELRDSQGQLIDPGMVQYYASGWKDFGTTSGGQVSMELLPKSYTFRMRYAGAAVDRTQDASADPVVVFQTTHVIVELRDSQGELIDAGVVQYYANGWKDFGTTSGGEVSKELLPKSYTFRMRYAGAAVDRTQDVSTDPWVAFNTGRVQSESGACTLYYAGGWQVFLNSMELLPGSYTFRFNDGTPDTVFDILELESNFIH